MEAMQGARPMVVPVSHVKGKITKCLCDQIITA